MSQYINKPYQVSAPMGGSFPYGAVADYEPRRETNSNRYLFFEGKFLDLTNPNLHFEVEATAHRGLERDFWPNNSGSLLAGPQGIQFLKEFCPGDVQFFQTHLHCKDQEVKSYYLVNLTHLVEAIDEGKSECTYWEDGELKRVRKYYFKENCMGVHHIARDSRYEGWIICSPEFVKEYKRRKLKGLKFTEDYSGKGDGLYRM